MLGALLASVAGAAVAAPGAGVASVPHVVGLNVTLKWGELFGAGSAIVESSTNIARLDASGPSVVVGSRMNGCVYAVHLADGTTAPGWGHVCTGYGIDSTPSVVQTGGGLENVVVSEGDITGLNPPGLNPGNGGIAAFGPGGNVLWSRGLADVFSINGPNPVVVASPAIGDTGTGATQIVVAGVSLSMYSLDPTTGATVPGWPQKTADSTFATAAIANVNGAQSILAGSDSTAGPGALDNWNGGAVRRVSANGATLWTAASNEVVSSGPAVGNLDGSGPLAVYGHGQYWNGSDDDGLTAVDAARGALHWEGHLGGYTLAAPALADLQGNGQLDVIEPTWRTLGQPTGGKVFAMSPSGSQLWSFAPQSATTITGSVASADFGQGYQDVVAATGGGWYLIDGRSGSAAAPGQGQWLANGFAGDPNAGILDMENATLVVPDPSGSGLDVVVAGTYYAVNNDNTQGFVDVYHVTDPSGSSHSVGARAWPQYKHDPQLTGSAIAPAPPPGSCIPDTPPCSTQGYRLSASDVGIFAYGNASFHGSMGGTPLNKPVVGMAADRPSGGYWEVASDGGIFAFHAPFYGSTGSIVLNKPVVGMAATHDGGG